ncbi:SNAP25 homologous protein SNAP33-like protein, partial [Tanacetum coccineum]
MLNSNTNLQTQSSNALHNAIMEAGSKDRPPMASNKPLDYVVLSRLKQFYAMNKLKKMALHLAQLGRHASAAIVATTLALLLKRTELQVKATGVLGCENWGCRVVRKGCVLCACGNGDVERAVLHLLNLELDDALSYLSNILGELKEMAVDMGSKIKRHNKAFNPLDNDVEELTIRVKGVNQ